MIGWNIYAKGRTKRDGNSGRVLGIFFFFSRGLTGLFKMPASNSSAEETTFLDYKLQEEKKKSWGTVAAMSLIWSGPKKVPKSLKKRLGNF